MLHSSRAANESSVYKITVKRSTQLPVSRTEVESLRTKMPRLARPSVLQVLVLACGWRRVAAAESRCISDISSAPLSLFLPSCHNTQCGGEPSPLPCPHFSVEAGKKQAATMQLVIRVQIAGTRTMLIICYVN